MATTNKKQPKPTGRKLDGTFKSGFCANPTGRPKGTANHATIIAQSLIDGEAENITRKIIDLALDGDASALRLCLERLVPRRMERHIGITMPEIHSAKDAAAALAQVSQAVTNGMLSLSEAKTLSDFIVGYLKCYETVHLEERLQQLESNMGAGG
jgi:hypothetical protein